MESTALTTKYERHLEKLRAHPTVGPSVRFYFRRREELLYLVVGAWNTLFGYGVWALLQYALGSYVPYLVVILMAWPIAVLNTYFGYRYVVFRSRAPIRTELPRFAIVYVGTLVATLVLLPLCLHVLPFNIYLVQALLMAVMVVCSYLSFKYFSFNPSHAMRSAGPSPEGPVRALDN